MWKTDINVEIMVIMRRLLINVLVTNTGYILQLDTFIFYHHLHMYIADMERNAVFLMTASQMMTAITMANVYKRIQQPFRGIDNSSFKILSLSFSKDVKEMLLPGWFLW